jgi:hypothetical protein
LTTCANSGGQEKEKEKKRGSLALSRLRPEVSGQPLVAGWQWVDTWTGLNYPFKKVKIVLFFILFWKFGEWASLLGQWVNNTPIF